MIAGKTTDQHFQKILAKIKASFDFGKWQTLSRDKFIVYRGKITKTSTGVTLDFKDYIKKASTLTTHAKRNSMDLLTEKDISKTRGLVGSLQWPASQGAQHLCASVSILAANVSGGAVQVMQDLNKTLRFAKANAEFDIKMTAVVKDINDACILCFSDAASKVRHDASSQGGYIIVMTHKAVLDGKIMLYNVLAWRSFTKLPRVCRSSLAAAESQALSAAVDGMCMVKLMLSPMFDPKQDLRSAETVRWPKASVAVVDAKERYDNVNRNHPKCPRQKVGSGGQMRQGRAR